MRLGGLLLGILSIGILKTAVMALSLVLLWQVLRALRGGARVPGSALADEGLRLPGWLFAAGLTLFSLSEITCAVEIYVIQHPTAALRMVHSFASAVGAGLLIYGGVLSLDRTVLHYLDQRRACFFVAACRGCPRRDGGRCKPHLLFFASVLLLTLMAVPPLFIPTTSLLSDPDAVALPWSGLNATYDRFEAVLQQRLPQGVSLTPRFVIPEAMTFAEFRIIPWVVLLLGAVALVTALMRQREAWSLGLASLMAGMLGYCYLEAAVYVLIPKVYIGSVGHEVAELVGLLMLRALLFDVLGRQRAPAATSGVSLQG